MPVFRRILVAAFAVIGAAAATAAGAQQTLVVGAYPANPPWEFKNEKGEFEGFEVDLVREICKRVGCVPEFQDMGFQALFAATSSGRIDAAISSITITDERLKNQAFTQGYYDSDLALIGGPNSKLKGLSDLKGATLGAISTSTGEAWIKQNTEKYGIGAYKGYNTQQDLLLEAQNGRIDGAVGDIAGFQFAFMKMPGMKVIERIPMDDVYGIMLRKGSPLLEKVDAAITEIKKDGTMAKLHEKWLGAKAEPDSSINTVRPIPAAQ